MNKWGKILRFILLKLFTVIYLFSYIHNIYADSAVAVNPIPSMDLYHKMCFDEEGNLIPCDESHQQIIITPPLLPSPMPQRDPLWWHNYIYNNIAVPIADEVQDHLIQESLKKINKLTLSTQVMGPYWRNQIGVILDNVRDSVPQLMREKLADKSVTSSSGLHNQEIIRDITHKLLVPIFKSRFQVLRNQQGRQITQLLNNPSTPRDWLDQLEHIIHDMETQAKTPNYRKLTLDGNQYEINDAELEKEIYQAEEFLYGMARPFINQRVIYPSQKKAKTHIDILDPYVNNTIQSTENVDITALYNPPNTQHEQYKKDIQNIPKEILKSKYKRHELGFLGDKDLTQPTEPHYIFQSPEGEFLNQIKGLYTRLYESNPHHEQGQIARHLGLSSVEIADEAYMVGKRAEADLAYQVGETLLDISLGVTPYVGFAKDVYEALSGHHLITGRKLSRFERAMSFAGIALSGMSTGIISSGHIKASINTTKKVLNNIQFRSLKKGYNFVQKTSSDLVTRSHKLFTEVHTLGLKTKKEIQNSFHFLRRAFAGDTPSIKGVSQTMHFIKRQGIAEYTETLRELAKKGIKLNRSGEEFLAYQMRFSDRILKKPIGRKGLLKLGENYAHLYREMDNVKPSTFEGTLWRGVRKSGVDKSGTRFVNPPEEVFKLRPEFRYKNGRYSPPGEAAIYGSLSKKTAIQEITTQSKKFSGKVEELFHIGQKNVKIDKVLDLTNPRVLKELSLPGKTGSLTKKMITKSLDKNPNKAYQMTHILGHIAKRKGFKAIKAPSAITKKADTIEEGVNIISFKEL